MKPIKRVKQVQFDREVTQPCLKFKECYKVRYPLDNGSYCTCLDYSPEI